MKFNVKPKGLNVAIAILSVVAVVCVVLCVLTFTTDLFTPQTDWADLVLYEGPKPVPASTVAAMKVDGNELFVYDTAVNNTHTWVSNYKPSLSKAPVTSFDFEGAPVTMEITVTGQTELGDVVVRPLAKGIVPTVTGNVITFTIAEPDVYTVEWGGSAMNAMHIFANAIDRDAPTESTDTVKYIGPGAWSIDTMMLTDGMEVYISGGAVIRGTIMGNKVNGAKISGHGIIDGSYNESWMLAGRTAYVPLSLSNCKDITVSGIAFLDPNAWCVNIYDCDQVSVDGVKIITARPNGDGITIQSSRDITVSNSFVRSWDDSLVVKNYSTNKGTDSANICFDNCQVWTDLAQSMEVGYETNKGGKLNPTIQNVTFRNITVLHNFHKPVMSIHNADDAAVSAIRYENIIVEDASMGKGDAGENAQLIDITIASSSWSSSKKRGTVDDVTFDGIYVLGGDDTIDFIEGNFCPINIRGYDDEHKCTNITVNNLFIWDEGVTDENVTDNPSTSLDKFTDNIHFTVDKALPETVAALLRSEK